MKPTLAQYQSSGASWNRTHKGVGYELSHHGISDYTPEGTWCYYLYLRAEMFQSADDFARFDKPQEIKPGVVEGKFWATYDYYAIPDLDFHGGVTWYSKEPYFDASAGENRDAIKIGCDYNHSWDRDGGYWQGMDEVDADARRSIDLLAALCPMNERCGYSGIYAHPDEFYTAINGRRVHRSQIDAFKDGWDSWLPLGDAA